MDSPSHDAYFLLSERIGFRAWSDADMDLAMALWGDPEVTRLIGGPFSPAQVRARLIQEITTEREHDVQYWPIFLRTTGEHVGCCGLRPYGAQAGTYELGAHIRRQHWNHGYAEEASRSVMEYAFACLQAGALWAGHHPDNAASRRLLGKLGFRYVRDEYYAPTGLNHPTYTLTAEEFRALESGVSWRGRTPCGGTG